MKNEGTVIIMSKDRISHFFSIARIFAYLDECNELENASTLEKSMAFVKAFKLLEPAYAYDKDKSTFKLTPNTFELSYYMKNYEIECMYPHGIFNEQYKRASNKSREGIGSLALEIVIDRVVKRVKEEETNIPVEMVKPLNADKIIDMVVKLDLQHDRIIIQRFINFLNSIIKEFGEGKFYEITTKNIINNEVTIKNNDYNRTYNQREFTIAFGQGIKELKFIYDFKKSELVSFENDIKFLSFPKPNFEPDTNVSEYLKADSTTPYCDLPPLSRAHDKMMETIDLSILWERGYHLSASKIEQHQLNLSSVEIGELVKYSDFSLAFQLTNNYLKSISPKAPVAILNLFNSIINEPLKRSQEHCQKVAGYILDNDIDFEQIYQTHLQNVSRTGLLEIAKIKLDEIHSSEGYLILQSLKLERALTNTLDTLNNDLHIESEYDSSNELAMCL